MRKNSQTNQNKERRRGDMKLRMLAAGAACAVPGLALAQSVTLYGVIKAWLYAARHLCVLQANLGICNG